MNSCKNKLICWPHTVKGPNSLTLWLPFSIKILTIFDVSSSVLNRETNYDRHNRMVLDVLQITHCALWCRRIFVCFAHLFSPMAKDSIFKIVVWSDILLLPLVCRPVTRKLRTDKTRRYQIFLFLAAWRRTRSCEGSVFCLSLMTRNDRFLWCNFKATPKVSR